MSSLEKQIAFMVAYKAACEGGNKSLAEKIKEQAENSGFKIIPSSN